MQNAHGSHGAWRRLLAAAESLAARAAVVLVLSAVAAIVRAGRALRGPRRQAGPADAPQTSRRATLLLTGTFYNPGWFRAHIQPLCRCDALDDIIVVCDRPLEAYDKVRYVCPPTWARRLMGRTGARLAWLWRAAVREKPAAVMGYHIMPNGLMALAVGALTGTPAVYQMTGGPVQIIGGGVGSENALLRRQRRPSRLRERLMFHVVRQFDCVVVRGARAAEFLRRHGLARDVRVIPGSVDCARFGGHPGPDARRRRFDLVGVGRLVPVKRWDRLIRIVAEINGPGAGGAASRPDVTLAIAGDGPLLDELTALARRLGVESRVALLGRREDVPEVLASARVFALTSENEGLSIAMIEAMAAGLPVVAPDVGDLGELLIDGENGRFIDPDRPAEAARVLMELLADEGGLARMSDAARRRAVAEYSVEAVAGEWSRLFAGPRARPVGPASGGSGRPAGGGVEEVRGGGAEPVEAACERSRP